METLEQKIEMLKREHALAEEIKRKLPGIKTLSRISTWKNESYGRMWFTAKDKSELIRAIDAYPPTVNSYKVTDQLPQVNSAYRVQIDNPAKYERLASVQWRSNDIGVEVNFPEEWIAEFCTRGTRPVTDCEYHYFTGVALSEIRQMKIRKMSFNTTQQVN